MSAKNLLLKACFLVIIILYHVQSSLASPLPSPAIKVQVDGQDMVLDTPPVIENGRTLVPLRAITEALGARVSWDGKSKTVTVVKNDLELRLTIGNTVALKNQEEIILDVPAKILRDRTMVPLRFVGEAMGAVVRWDPLSRLVSISRPIKEEKPRGELVIKGDIVNIRSGPGTNHDILTQVSRGTRLPVLDRLADWYKVQLPGGKTGWIIGWYTTEETSSPPTPSPSSEKTETAIPIHGPGENKPVEQEEQNNSQTGQPEAPLDDKQVKDKGTIASPESPDGKENETTESEEQGPEKQEIRVSISQENDFTRVTVTSNQKVTYDIFRLSQPDRLVMNISGVQPGDLPASQTINSKEVNKLRVGWFSRDPDITRLVLDLKEKVLYRAETSADQKAITLDIFIPNIKAALQDRTIVLDPGHGGTDPGAIGQMLGLKEKDVNLDVAQRTSRLLSGYGARVILTRSGDNYVDLYERAQKANSAGADLFISIHMNSNNSTLLKGTSTYYMRTSEDDQRLRKSRHLAGQIQTTLLATLGLEDRGIHQADFVVLRKTAIPSVLVEAAFISNPEEEKLMATEQFRENVAQAIVQGIGNYFLTSW